MSENSKGYARYGVTAPREGELSSRAIPPTDRPGDKTCIGLGAINAAPPRMCAPSAWVSWPESKSGRTPAKSARTLTGDFFELCGKRERVGIAELIGDRSHIGA